MSLLGGPQDSQPIFRHTGDLWRISFAQSLGQVLLPSDANHSFTCMCCSFMHIRFTFAPLIATWAVVTEAEVLTIFLHCKKNALPLQRTQNMFVLKQKAF